MLILYAPVVDVDVVVVVVVTAAAAAEAAAGWGYQEHQYSVGYLSITIALQRRGGKGRRGRWLQQ